MRDWLCGATARIRPGDRLFLMRQRHEPRGLFASGEALAAPRRVPHYHPRRAASGLSLRAVRVRFESLLDPAREPLLSREKLRHELPGGPWDSRSSGVQLMPEVACRLGSLWHAHRSRHGCGAEDSGSQSDHLRLDRPDFLEGGRVAVRLVSYERNARARAACLAAHGTRCRVCDLDFGEEYGPLLGGGFIHVHHLVPLSAREGEYALDPVRDLVPVCPNCHAMLHRRDPPIRWMSCARSAAPHARRASSMAPGRAFRILPSS